MAKTSISILSTETSVRVEALKNSRLKPLIQDNAMFAKICEAAALLLNSEKLRACDESSILGSLITAVNMGFRLQPEYAECHLIPRKIKLGKDSAGKDVWGSVCTFQVGYKGYKARALESGHIKYLEAREVYKEDEFKIRYGTSPELDHVPAEVNSGVTTWFYAKAMLTTGEIIFSHLNKQGAEKYRRFSESQYDKQGKWPNETKVFSEKPKDVWLHSYAKMALRAPIKDLCAMLPLTPRIEEALENDGSIKYLQKDGTITTISPVSVEEIAEKIEETQVPVKKGLAGEFERFKDALSKHEDWGFFIDNYIVFSKTDLYKEFEFVKLYFEKAVELASEKAQLDAFWSLSKTWQRSPELTKILSNRKQAIIENEKSK